MFRITLAAAAVYACGCPGLDGHRPASFDKPLQGFYNEVNVTATESTRVFSLLNKERTQHYFDLFKQRFAAVVQESRTHVEIRTSGQQRFFAANTPLTSVTSHRRHDQMIASAAASGHIGTIAEF